MSVCVIPCSKCNKALNIKYNLKEDINIQQEAKKCVWDVVSISDSGIKYICQKCNKDD